MTHLIKRLCDIIFSALGLVLLAPLLALIAVWVRLDSPGPALFVQQRTGKGGKPFNLVKFRTMDPGCDQGAYLAHLHELIESEIAGDGQPYRKPSLDPRVTRAGCWLRKTYLDELPQLWNVLCGEMSLVGPRPHVPFEVAHYTIEQRRRLSIRPGLTGLWQVSAPLDCTFSELIALDLAYIDRWSLALDLRILVRTAWLAVQGSQQTCQPPQSNNQVMSHEPAGWMD